MQNVFGYLMIFPICYAFWYSVSSNGVGFYGYFWEGVKKEFFFIVGIIGWFFGLLISLFKRQVEDSEVK